MAIMDMGTLGLTELYQFMNDDKERQIIINMLAQTNSMLADAYQMPCNKGDRHEHRVMTGLPAVTWGKLYKGTPNSKGKYATVEDVTGFVEGRASVDKRLISLNPKAGNRVRLMESKGFLEAISQEMQSALIYSSQKTSPEQITGLAPRFSDGNAETGSQIVDGGGTGSNNTSVWFVTWGMQECAMIHPKNIPAGIERDDHGECRVEDENGNAYQALEETFRWHAGMTVSDWRKVSRIANIDVDELRAGNVDLFALMRKAYYKLHGVMNVDIGTPSGDPEHGNYGKSRTVIYCNADIFEALDALSTNSGNTDNYVRLTREQVEGQQVDTYRGFPVRRVDAILNTEEQVPNL